MANLAKLMKQAAAVQRDMERLQEGLAQRTAEFASGGGMVKVTARGDGSIASIRIDPGVIRASDPDLLEDMVLAAVNGALQAAREMAAAEMGKLTASLGLPNMGGGKS
jgi:DNA-binding YbaB/EbfC family protein